jgi:hypothetical protein
MTVGPRVTLPLAAAGALLFFSCGGDQFAEAPKTPDAGAGVPDAGTDVVTCSPLASRAFVANRVKMPASTSEFAVDLDGDGDADNRLGSLMPLVASQGIDVQAVVDADVAAGRWLLLFRQASLDPAFGSDSRCASLRASLGDARGATPKLDGTDSFIEDRQFAGADWPGAIAAGTFTSSAPRTIDVYLSVGLAPLLVPVRAARITLGTSPARGQLNGGILQTDVTKILVPALANEWEAHVQQDPQSSNSKAVLDILDKGDGSGGTCTGQGGIGTPGDGHIAVCEVAASPVVQGILAPDVHLFDAAGNVAPSPTGSKDSFSVGFEFTVVPATVAVPIP